MKEHTFTRSIEIPVPLTEPNFDDERTVRSARPVVPLAKIDAKMRHRRHWLMGGAFALAMMLGAASALLASYLKLRSVPNPVTRVSEVETTAAPVAAAAEPVASELPVNEDTEKVEDLEESAAPVAPRKAPAERRRTIMNRNSASERPRVVRETSDDNELERIREAVLLDAWEERRARRAARRERRNQADHHDRDLSNLDEIFEGRRRRRP